MKRNNIVALAAALLGLWGCGEGGLNAGALQGQGRVTITLEPGSAIVITTKASSSVDVAGFGVNILTEQGEEAYSNSSYSDVPKDLALEAGSYVMNAHNNGIQEGAEFDRPYYAGSTSFSVKVGEETPVKVVCELKSTGVEVTYTDKIQTELTDIWVTVKTKYGEKSSAVLHYDLNEKRTGWFSIPNDGKMNITVGGLRDGKPITNNISISKVAAKELRRIKLDIKTSGSSGTQIDIDTTVIIKDVTIAVPDADDVIDNNGDNGSWEEGGDPTPDPTEGPTVVGQSLNGEAFNIDEIVKIDASTQVLDVLMSSQAAGGIQNLMLEVKSSLLEVVLSDMFGITGPIDLANPPQGADAPGWVAGFAELGLLDPKNPINGKSEHLFSVGALMGMLVSLVDEGKGEPYYFNLQVTDAKGTTKKSLTVVVVAPK